MGYVPNFQSGEDFERETLAMLRPVIKPAAMSPRRSVRPAIPLRWHGEADPHADRSWLVRGIIPERGKGLLSGQWGTCKTFTVFDLAGAIMTGLPFAGHKVERVGGVLLVAAEGAFEVSIRLDGLIEGKIRPAGTENDLPDLNRLPFVWVEECPRLVEPDALEMLCVTADAAAKRFRDDFDLPLALIIFDTLAAAAGFDDENSAAETQKVMNALEALSRHTGAFVLGVDHFGKAVDTGTRGSSAKEAAADMVLAMLGEKDVAGNVANVRMAVRKVRGARCGHEIPLTLQVLELGETEDGEPITTCFIAWQTTEQAGRRSATTDRWPKPLKPFRQALANAIAGYGGKVRPFGADGPEITAVSEVELRREFHAAYPAAGETDEQRYDAKRKAFKRSVKTAIELDLVASRDISGVDHLWFTTGL